MIGRTLGHYRIDEQLGVGGNGTVYRAEDTRTATPVALKFPHATLVATPAARGRWIAGARAALALDHPNIVATHEVCVVDDEMFVAMELAGSRTLRDRLELGPVPLRETLAIGRAVTLALEHAHGRGVLHADLKPENVLLATSGGVKVADFCTQPPRAEGSGLAELTPEYVAPEVAGGGDAEAGTDLYGLGLLLYEMISGHPPFSGSSVADVLRRVVAEPPPPLPAAAPTALQQLIETLLAKRPAGRPAGAAVVLERFAAMGA